MIILQGHANRPEIAFLQGLPAAVQHLGHGFHAGNDPKYMAGAQIYGISANSPGPAGRMPSGCPPVATQQASANTQTCSTITKMTWSQFHK